MSVPNWLAVVGSPIIAAGTLAIAPATGQTLHQVIGTGSTTAFGPITLATADLPFTYSGTSTQLGTTLGTFVAGTPSFRTPTGI
jgi:hypothetical protein